jgi:hypothetical protein
MLGNKMSSKLSGLEKDEVASCMAKEVMEWNLVVGWEVDRPGSGRCLLVGFGIARVEPAVPATRELVVN